jgi:hypothetical protein
MYYTKNGKGKRFFLLQNRPYRLQPPTSLLVNGFFPGGGGGGKAAVV